MMNYSAGDFLIRIKNAALASAKEVVAKKTNLNLSLANALKRAGFIDKVEDKDGQLTLTLVYKSKQPRLMDLKLISKPGLRIYKNVEDLEKFRSPSILFVSTPKGILSSREAIKERVAGEVIAEVW